MDKIEEKNKTFTINSSANHRQDYQDHHHHHHSQHSQNTCIKPACQKSIRKKKRRKSPQKINFLLDDNAIIDDNTINNKWQGIKQFYKRVGQRLHLVLYNENRRWLT